ncbi:LAMI_0F15588g1_1 [Lachancea mirantina]|uniref:LAMI_0F15588g1_1 n=1 Tax=Lachancea mirantina TaxID=1230905 RepID=A0A1G4K4G4_9SACH|nr:LAMI_0F15588g1_1 [Lachancea mirantina]
MVDSISRITSALESAKEMTLEAAAIAQSKLGESSYQRYSQRISPQSLPNLLNSRNPREVKDGMKRVVSVMASGDEGAALEGYFADVVKNITSNDVKIKRLVAVYLQRFAERDPNLALLSINSIQKSISDSNPEVRSLSLKALSDIRVPALYPIILHSIKKSMTDACADVRSTVALALLKIYREQGDEVADDVLPLTQDLLSDADPQVVSAAILLFKEAFPKKLELLHGHFRRFCEILPQLSEWAQVSMIELLIRYCKEFLPRPQIIDSSNPSSVILLPSLYNTIPFAIYDVSLDPDLELFLDAARNLRHSANAALIVSIGKAFFYLSPPLSFKNSKISTALANLITTSEQTGLKVVILQCILVFCSRDPTLFQAYIKRFFVFPSDDAMAAVTKIKILSFLLTLQNAKEVASEIKFIILNDSRDTVIQEALNALAMCSRLSQSWSNHITRWLLKYMGNENTMRAMDAYVNVIRSLIQTDPKSHLNTMMGLSEILFNHENLSATAKAGIIWLFGEFSEIEFSICPDVLRRFIQTFSSEGREARMQIVLLAAKLLSRDIDNFKNSEEDDKEYDFGASRLSQMFNAVLYLAKFDDDFDIRDRARLLSSLFENNRQVIASLLLQVPKVAPVGMKTTESSEMDDIMQFSALGLDSDIEDYFTRIEWSVNLGEYDSSVREPVPLKDYSRLKTSFSSKTYFGSSTPERTTKGVSHESSFSQNTLTTTTGRKYKLQSLDEFFSDVPAEKPKVKRIVVEEESSNEDDDTETSDDEDDEDDDDDVSEDAESEND